MMSFLHSCFDKLTEARKQKLPHYVYIDDMNYNSSPSKLGKEVDGEPKVSKINGRVEEKGGLRVKILMTKEEAARLLSKCRDGGVLGFKDVAHELVRIPTSRISVVCGSASNDRALATIPEVM